MAEGESERALCVEEEDEDEEVKKNHRTMTWQFTCLAILMTTVLQKHSKQGFPPKCKFKLSSCISLVVFSFSNHLTVYYCSVFSSF